MTKKKTGILKTLKSTLKQSYCGVKIQKTENSIKYSLLEDQITICPFCILEACQK